MNLGRKISDERNLYEARIQYEGPKRNNIYPAQGTHSGKLTSYKNESQTSLQRMPYKFTQ